jgi:hypothetical protein
VARSCERAAAGSRKAALVARGWTADDRIDGYTKSRHVLRSFAQSSRESESIHRSAVWGAGCRESDRKLGVRYTATTAAATPSQIM